jgi:hypothetical protein
MSRFLVLAAAAALSTLPVMAQEPPRAPGSAPLQGTVSSSISGSGTTTNYAAAPPAAEPAWPCAQRKVATISAGTIWSGPDLAQVGASWEDDYKLAQIAQKLASRRTELSEADAAIADFAKAAGADKDKQLTKLFAGVLDIINEDRNKILHGITRYAAGQERLAERLRDESDKISAQQNEPKINFAAGRTGNVSDYEWDQRIFNERRQALSYVCETPSLLEHRAFEIARRIQAQL